MHNGLFHIVNSTLTIYETDISGNNKAFKSMSPSRQTPKVCPLSVAIRKDTYPSYLLPLLFSVSWASPALSEVPLLWSHHHPEICCPYRQAWESNQGREYVSRGWWAHTTQSNNQTIHHTKSTFPRTPIPYQSKRKYIIQPYNVQQ